MPVTFKKFQVLLTSTILIGSFQLNNSFASANNLEISKEIPGNINVEINKSQVQKTINDVSNKYNLLLKGFSGIFTKNSPDTGEIIKVSPDKKIISRGDRKKQITHRSLAV